MDFLKIFCVLSVFSLIGCSDRATNPDKGTNPGDINIKNTDGDAIQFWIIVDKSASTGKSQCLAPNDSTTFTQGAIGKDQCTFTISAYDCTQPAIGVKNLAGTFQYDSRYYYNIECSYGYNICTAHPVAKEGSVTIQDKNLDKEHHEDYEDKEDASEKKKVNPRKHVNERNKK